MRQFGRDFTGCDQSRGLRCDDGLSVYLVSRLSLSLCQLRMGSLFRSRKTSARSRLGPLSKSDRRDRDADGYPGFWLAKEQPHGGACEIGGRVENSRRQTYYALPLGKPLSFNDELSASGTLSLRHIGLRGVAYIGFFNSQRHTCARGRLWPSGWEEDGLGQVMFDWMSSDWQARGAETAILLQPDGQVHTWSFHYEPDARADPNWHDKVLERHITDRTGNGADYELQGEEHLFERLKRKNRLSRGVTCIRD